MKVKVKVAQSCLTLCNRMDYTVRGILQARILEWVAYPFSRGSSRPRNWTRVSYVAGRFFTSRATREAQRIWKTIEVSVVQAHPDLLDSHKSNEFITILVIWGRSVRNYWIRRKIERKRQMGQNVGTMIALVVQWERLHLPIQETWVQPLVWEDPLKEEMATHSSILAWEIPWTEQPGGLQS